MLRLVVICFFIILKTSFVFSQSLQFYEEALFFEIKDGYFEVDGQYWFRNSGSRDIHQIMFYPFPRDEMLGKVDSIFITDVAGFEEDLIINQTEKGVSFRINIEADQEKIYRIYYRQRTPNRIVKYILTTTGQWGQPLNKAFYQLKMHSDISITYFSYPPDKEEKQSNYHIYYWYMESFMPDKECVVEWD